MCSWECVGFSFVGMFFTSVSWLVVIFTCCWRFKRLPAERECERASGPATCPRVEILGRLREFHIHTDMSVTCAICLEALIVGDVAKELHCQHIFHSDCLNSWCSHQLRGLENTSFRCPLCRELQSEGPIEEGAVVRASL